MRIRMGYSGLEGIPQRLCFLALFAHALHNGKDVADVIIRHGHITSVLSPDAQDIVNDTLSAGAVKLAVV